MTKINKFRRVFDRMKRLVRCFRSVGWKRFKLIVWQWNSEESIKTSWNVALCKLYHAIHLEEGLEQFMICRDAYYLLESLEWAKRIHSPNGAIGGK